MPVENQCNSDFNPNQVPAEVGFIVRKMSEGDDVLWLA